MRNFMHERSQLQKRIDSGTIVSADLQIAAEIAKRTSASQDRVNFVKVKRILTDKALEVDGGVI